MVEDNIPVGASGSVGDLDLKASGSGISETFTSNKTLLGGAIQIAVSESITASPLALLNAVKSFVESKLPAGKAIEEFAFAEIESFISSLK